jgi:hypothetical protein
VSEVLECSKCPRTSPKRSSVESKGKPPTPVKRTCQWPSPDRAFCAAETSRARMPPVDGLPETPGGGASAGTASSSMRAPAWSRRRQHSASPDKQAPRGCFYSFYRLFL